MRQLPRSLSLCAPALREAGLLAGIVLLLLVAWPFLGPFRLLAVGFHEAGHAIVAVATGGRVIEVSVFGDESGRVLTTGGSPVLILNGGYLGSVVAGLLLLRAARALRRRSSILAWILRVTGAFSALYALVDLRDDLFRLGGPAPASDASLLAEATGIPALVWGIGWLIVGSVVVAAGLVAELRSRRGWR